MDKMYSVDALAQTCDVTPRTVRLYVEKKLLEPHRIGRSFIFTADSVDRLKTIRRDKCIGLTLDEIKARLDANNAEDIQKLIIRFDDVIKAARLEKNELIRQLANTPQHRS